jgi:hypothetical protein
MNRSGSPLMAVAVLILSVVILFGTFEIRRLKEVIIDAEKSANIHTDVSEVLLDALNACSRRQPHPTERKKDILGGVDI